MSVWLVFDTQAKQIGAATTYGGALSWAPIEGREKSWVHATEQALSAIGVKSATEVEQITVIQGKGGFSDTRGAVVLANTLAWQKPGLKLHEILATDSATRLTETDLVQQGKAVTELKPVYFAEPNITKAK